MKIKTLESIICCDCDLWSNCVRTCKNCDKKALIKEIRKLNRVCIPKYYSVLTTKDYERGYNRGIREFSDNLAKRGLL